MHNILYEILCCIYVPKWITVIFIIFNIPTILYWNQEKFHLHSQFLGIFLTKKQTSVQFTQWRTGCKMNLHYPTPLCNCCTDMYVDASPVWLKILLNFFFFWLTFASTIFNKLRWKDVLVSFFFHFEKKALSVVIFYPSYIITSDVKIIRGKSWKFIFPIGGVQSVAQFFFIVSASAIFFQ